MKKERLFTNRQLLTLLWPLIIEQMLEILVGMADTVMVSSVGEAAISGVSLVDMINQLIITLFGALATGGAVVTSQHLGAKRPGDAAKSAGQLVGLSAILGVGVAAFCLITRTAQLRLFFGTITDEVMQACLTYFTITALSFPFLALYNAGAAIFRSTGNSAVSMKVSVIVNGINLGRYWQRGPIHSLYCPKEFLKKGTNEIVIFETEGIEINELIFCGQPIVKKLLTNDFSEIGSNIHNHIDS